MPQRIGYIRQQVRKTVAVEIRCKNDNVPLVHQIPEKQSVVRVGDMLLDLTGPVLHAVFEIVRQERDDAIDAFTVLFIPVDGPFPTDLRTLYPAASRRGARH